MPLDGNLPSNPKDKPTHVTKHQAEYKSAGRLIPGTNECIRGDPRRRGQIRRRKTKDMDSQTHRTPTPLWTSANSVKCPASSSPRGEVEPDAKACATSNTAVALSIMEDN
jgi:hypothetical protein